MFEYEAEGEYIEPYLAACIQNRPRVVDDLSKNDEIIGAKVKKAHAIIFLVGPGELVLLDDPLEILLTTCGSHDPNLRVRAHFLPIKIKRRL